MSEIKTILFATDFSELSAKAQEQTAWLIERLGSDLHVIHVFDPDALNMPAPYYFMPSVDEWIQEHTDKARERARALLDKVRTDLGDAAISHFVEGKPGHEIEALAKEIGADMIVMGSHGYRGFSRLVLGSVAEHVLRHAECPVLAIKRSDKKD